MYPQARQTLTTQRCGLCFPGRTTTSLPSIKLAKSPPMHEWQGRLLSPAKPTLIPQMLNAWAYLLSSPLPAPHEAGLCRYFLCLCFQVGVFLWGATPASLTQNEIQRMPHKIAGRSGDKEPMTGPSRAALRVTPPNWPIMETASCATIRKAENPLHWGTRIFCQGQEAVACHRYHICLSAPRKLVAGHWETAMENQHLHDDACWQKTGEAAARWLPPYVRLLYAWRECV